MSKKLGQKVLKQLVSRLDDIKKQKSELAANEKGIKEQLEEHLTAVKSDTVAVGNRNICLAPSTCIIEVKRGVKKAEATRDLVAEMLKSELGNLVEQKPKMSLLYEFQQEKDKKVCDMLKGLGIKVVQNKSLKVVKN